MVRPEVEDEITTSAGTRVPIFSYIDCFSARFSGTLSCTKSALAQASARSVVTVRRSREAPSARPNSSRLSQAASISPRSFSSSAPSKIQAVTS